MIADVERAMAERHRPGPWKVVISTIYGTPRGFVMIVRGPDEVRTIFLRDGHIDWDFMS